MDKPVKSRERPQGAQPRQPRAVVGQISASVADQCQQFVAIVFDLGAAHAGDAGERVGRGRAPLREFAQRLVILKRDRPRFSFSQFRMQPAGIKIGAIRPGEGAEFDPNLGEEIGVAQQGIDARIARYLDRRAIDDSVAPIPEADGQPIIRQDGHCQNPPRRGGNHSSGWIFLGCCLA